MEWSQSITMIPWYEIIKLYFRKTVMETSLHQTQPGWQKINSYAKQNNIKQHNITDDTFSFCLSELFVWSYSKLDQISQNIPVFCKCGTIWNSFFEIKITRSGRRIGASEIDQHDTEIGQQLARCLISIRRLYKCITLHAFEFTTDICTITVQCNLKTGHIAGVWIFTEENLMWHWPLGSIADIPHWQV